MLILELLGKHPVGLNLVEIARALEIPNNSVFRIASTLTQMGYLHRCEKTKRFVMTRKLLGIGYASVSQQNIVAVSMEFLKLLRDEVKETVALAILLPQEAVLLVLAEAKSAHPFGYHLEEGMRTELHSAAPGKAILAFLPESELTNVLGRMPFTRFNERTISCRKKLATELAGVKKSGVAFDRQEMMDGCHCVAAPIFDENGYPIAAIWTTGPSNRLTAKELPEVGKKVKAAADKIAARLSLPI